MNSNSQEERKEVRCGQMQSTSSIKDKAVRSITTKGGAYLSSSLCFSLLIFFNFFISHHFSLITTLYEDFFVTFEKEGSLQNI